MQALLDAWGISPFLQVLIILLFFLVGVYLVLWAIQGLLNRKRRKQHPPQE